MWRGSMSEGPWQGEGPGVSPPIAGGSPPDPALVASLLPRFDAGTRFVAERVLLAGQAPGEVAAALGVSPWAVSRKLSRFLEVARRPLALALVGAAVAACGAGTPAAAVAPSGLRARAAETEHVTPAPAPAPAPVAETPAAAEPAGPAGEAISTGSEPPAAAAPSAREVDLEFSAGLAEPSQVQVRPAPEPWRPGPAQEPAAGPTIADVWPDKAQASGGTRVAIRGTGLGGAQVVFGLAPARILEHTGDGLVVEAPPGAVGPVAIAVTSDDGRYALADVAFEYYR